MKCIVDTNVLEVANGKAPQASRHCTVACARRLRDHTVAGTVVLDSEWLILREYQSHARFEGQPGVGDAFLKWVLTNRTNPHRCELVIITPRDVQGSPGFAELPDELCGEGTDRSDRKFIAVALAHPEHPPIVNAVDSDWWLCQGVLDKHGVSVDNLCPDAAPKASS